MLVAMELYSLATEPARSGAIGLYRENLAALRRGTAMKGLAFSTQSSLRRTEPDPRSDYARQIRPALITTSACRYV